MSFYGDTSKWGFGVVEDTNDPLRAGRVRVRVFGVHDPDDNVLPYSDLPWSQVMLPVTEAGISGLGRSPTGLVQGSKVYGVFLDGESKQNFAVLGVMAGVNAQTPIQSEVGITPFSLRGRSIPEQVYNFFVTRGYGEDKAAGIVASMVYFLNDPTLEPDTLHLNNRYGLPLVTEEANREFQEWAVINAKETNTVLAQLEWIDLKLGDTAWPNYRDEDEVLREPNNAVEASDSFVQNFYRLSTTDNRESRLRLADQVLAAYGSTTGGDTGPFEERTPPAQLQKGHYVSTRDELYAYFLGTDRGISECIVHHTDTFENMDTKVADIDQWHKDRGFDEIGYHFIICRDGKIQIGRDINRVGAHAAGRNSNSVGIAFVGGRKGHSRDASTIRTKDTFTDAQWASFDMFLMTYLWAFPNSNFVGHRDVDPSRRTDPEFDVRAYVSSRAADWVANVPPAPSEIPETSGVQTTSEGSVADDSYNNSVPPGSDPTFDPEAIDPTAGEVSTATPSEGVQDAESDDIVLGPANPLPSIPDPSGNPLPNILGDQNALGLDLDGLLDDFLNLDQVNALLLGYVSTTALTTTLADYATQSFVDTRLLSYYNKTEVDNLLAGLSSIDDTDDVPEGATNLYYTTARANAAIDTRVNNTFVENLGIASQFVQYDNALSSLVASNVKTAIDELDVRKADVEKLSSNIILYPTIAAADIGGYFKLVQSTEDPDYPAETNVSTGAIGDTDTLISTLISDAGVFVGNPGVISVTTLGNIRQVSGNRYATFWFELWKRDAGGTETLLTTSGMTPPISSTSYIQFAENAQLSNGTFLATDRLVIRYYGVKSQTGGNNPVYDFRFGGDDPVRTLLPVPVSVIPSSDASDILVDTSSFSDILGPTDSTVQEALETLDGAGIWTSSNDGAGSGLDADFLDGIQGSNYARTDIAETFNNNLTVVGDLTVSGTLNFVNSNQVDIGDSIILLNADETGTPTQDGGFEIERGTSANVSILWSETNDYWHLTEDGTNYYKIITSNDFGPGSGIDADRVDGLEAVQFLRSDVIDTLEDGVIVTNSKDIRFLSNAGTWTGDRIYKASGDALRIHYSGNAHIIQALDANDVQWRDSTDTIRMQFFPSTALLRLDGNNVLTTADEGSGNGLDADLWDGKEFADYLDQGVRTSDSPTFADLNVLQTGSPVFELGTTAGAGTESIFRMIGARTTTSNRIASIQFQNNITGTPIPAQIDVDGDGDIDVVSGQLLVGGAPVLTSADGGDAGTLDGLNSTQFLRSDANDTASGNLTFTGVNRFDDSLFIGDGTIDVEIIGRTAVGFGIVGTDTAHDLVLRRDNVERLRLTSTGVDITGILSDDGNRVLTVADEGPDNGLDADTVDGIQGASFVRGDAVDNGQVDIIVDNADFIVRDTGAAGITNYIWGDHSAGVLYLGTPDYVATLRSDLNANSNSISGVDDLEVDGFVALGENSISADYRIYGAWTTDRNANSTQGTAYFYNNAEGTPDASLTADRHTYGVYARARLNDSSTTSDAFTRLPYGLYALADVTSGHADVSYGVHGLTYAAGASANITTGTGVYGESRIYNAGSIVTNMIGVYGTIRSVIDSDQNVSTVEGVRSYINWDAPTTITNAYFFRGFLDTEAGSSISNLYGIDIDMTSNLTAATNVRPLYLQAAASSNPRSSINGWLHIGGDNAFVTPSAPLEVDGDTIINGSLTLSIGVGVSSILDEDTMSSNSATALATQQSIKAYVDNQFASGTVGNANTLDGLDSTQFLRSDTNDTFTGTSLSFGSTTRQMLNLFNTSYGIGVQSSTQYYRSNDNFAWFVGGTHSNTAFDAGGGIRVMHYNDNASTFYILDNEVWHAGNDGSGSGLDADTLDGVQLSNIARTDVQETFGDNVFVDGNIYVRNTATTPTTSIWLQYDQGGGNPATIFARDSSNWNDSLRIYQNDIRLFAGGTQFRVTPSVITYDGNTVWHAGNDGSGSGLDADLLDGQHGSYYQNASNLNAGTLPNARLPTVPEFQGINVFKADGGAWVAQHYRSTTDTADLAIVYNGSQWELRSEGSTSGGFVFQTFAGSYVDFPVTPKVSGSDIWHQGNDGSGSGLDADTVDGFQASQFLRSDASDTMSGSLTVSNSLNAFEVEAGEGSGSVALTINDGYGNANLTFNHRSGVPDTTGSSARIETTVDSATANMYFELGDSTTSGVVTGLSTIMGLNTSSVDMFKFIDMNNNNIANVTNLNGTAVSNYWTTANDGSGSGLDADLLDGQHGSFYQNANNINAGTLNSARLSSDLGDRTLGAAFYRYYASGETDITTLTGGSTSGHIAEAPINAHYVIGIRGNDSGDGFHVIDTGNTSGGNYSQSLLRVSSSTFTHKGNAIWHAGNDGAGSGLDADLLDGLQSTQFLRSDQNDTLSNGALEIVTSTHASSLEFLRLRPTDHGVGNPWLAFKSVGGGQWQLIMWDGAATNGTLNVVSTALNHNGETVWDSGNDGAGSGLDADLLDGLNLVTGSATGNTVAGRNASGDIFARLVRTTFGDQGSTPASSAAIAFRNNSTTDNYIRTMEGAAFVGWLGSHDGSGSGLDADLLDGVQGSSYLRSDTADTASGSINFTAGLTYGSTRAYQSKEFTHSYTAASGVQYIRLGRINNGSHVLRIGNMGNSGYNADVIHINCSYSAVGANNTHGNAYITHRESNTSSNEFQDYYFEYVTQQQADVWVKYSSAQDHTLYWSFSGQTVAGGFNEVSTSSTGTEPCDPAETMIYTDQNYSFLQNGILNRDSLAITYDPPGGGAGTDTATDVAVAMASGMRIVGTNSGYIRSLLEWNNGSDIAIGQGGTSLIGGIDLLPGSSGVAKVNGSTIWHAGNDGSGSGLDADTVDGLHANTGAIANTIAARDGNGDISMRYGFSSYLNMSHGVSTRSSDTIFFSSSDNYIRKTNQAGMRAALNVWHPDNDGSGSGLDADLLDGLHASNFARAGARTDNYVWVRRNSTGSALYVTNQSTGHICDFRSGAGDGSSRAWIANNGAINSANDITAYASDIRLKENIVEIDSALDKLDALRGVTYDWKEECESLGFQPVERHEHGMIAQEVEKIIPDAVRPAPFNNEYKTIKYDRVVPLLVQAAKEEKKKREALEDEVKELKELVKTLINNIER